MAVMSPRRNIYLLGLLSLFNNLSADMVAPLLPVYLISLGAGATLLGAMEGLANALSYGTVLWAGYYSDRHRKTKSLTIWGYRVCALIRLVMAVPSVPVVFSARLIDRIGKGIRTAPRDRLLTSSIPQKEWGGAFGIQRAMDHAGSLAAPLVASFLLSTYSLDYTRLFLVAAVPALVAGILIPFLIREPKVREDVLLGKSENPYRLTWGRLHPTLKKYVAIIFLSSFSTPSELFLIYRMQELGAKPGEIPMVWFVLTLFALIAAYFGGLTAGWWGKRRTILVGWSLFALVYIGFGSFPILSLGWVMIALYGIHMGLIESSERVIAASLVEAEQRASAIGWYYFAYGMGALPASLLFGFLWNHVSVPFAFFWNAGITVVSILLFAILLDPRKGLNEIGA